MGQLFERVFDPEQVLDGIERWASGYEMLREFGGQDLPGRFDGLLVPTGRDCNQAKQTDRWWWERFGLAVVEVKVERADFLAALKNGQLEKYRDFGAIAGVYLASWRGVAKTSELPEGIGHLIVGWGEPNPALRYRERVPRCVCKRKPEWKATTPTVALMWRIIFALEQKYLDEQHERQKLERKYSEQLHSRLAEKLWKPLRRLEAEAEAAMGEKVKR